MRIILCVLELRLIPQPVTSSKIHLSRLFLESRLPSNGSFIRLAWNRPQSGSLGGRSFTKEARVEVLCAQRAQGTVCAHGLSGHEDHGSLPRPRKSLIRNASSSRHGTRPGDSMTQSKGLGGFPKRAKQRGGKGGTFMGV